MSKELAFTDDNDVVKYLDTTTAFNLALTADGVAFDLTNAKSILVKIANDDGYIMQQTIDLTTVTSPLGGTLSFPINQDIMNTLVPDDYDIEVWVTMNDGTQAIFPSDGTLGFSIEENLMSDTGEVIPTITLNDFQQQFDDLSSQMENAVHNVQKGDQGNPGNGIKAANNQYQLSDSPVTVPTGNWSDTILATTDQLPYLWTKIIFIYDDGTTKETNFVSSRGDTGSQGPIGPVGPQGKQGNGLVVRGKADKEENLPTTGNNQGDGYLVGTDLYIWIDGSWQNMGSITPDLADYVKVTDMNNALNTKVNVTDMRKPASDVAGIEEVNAKQDKIAYTPADDSKVAHLSGANNFDTTPTVNNNPLLLASSLPSDLARTGSDQEYTGKNIFDTAPIDKKTGNPYITKDGVPIVPSTLADTTKLANFTDGLQKSGKDVATTADVTSAVNSATANVATTDKLANFTAGLQSNGINVATVGVSVGDIYPMDPTDSLNIGSGLITITNVTNKNISGNFKLSALMVCDQMSGLAVPSFPDKFTKNISITIANNNVQSVGNDVNGGTYTIVNYGKGVLGFSPRPNGGSSSNAEVLYGTASGTFTCDV